MKILKLLENENRVRAYDAKYDPSYDDEIKLYNNTTEQFAKANELTLLHDGKGNYSFGFDTLVNNDNLLINLDDMGKIIKVQMVGQNNNSYYPQTTKDMGEELQWAKSITRGNDDTSSIHDVINALYSNIQTGIELFVQFESGELHVRMGLRGVNFDSYPHVNYYKVLVKDINNKTIYSREM